MYRTSFEDCKLTVTGIDPCLQVCMSAIVITIDYRKLKQYDVGMASSDTYEGYPESKF
jgi:hypothetical protein